MATNPGALEERNSRALEERKRCDMQVGGDRTCIIKKCDMQRAKPEASRSRHYCGMNGRLKGLH